MVQINLESPTTVCLNQMVVLTCRTPIIKKINLSVGSQRRVLVFFSVTHVGIGPFCNVCELPHLFVLLLCDRSCNSCPSHFPFFVLPNLNFQFLQQPLPHSIHIILQQKCCLQVVINFVLIIRFWHYYVDSSGMETISYVTCSEFLEHPAAIKIFLLYINTIKKKSTLALNKCPDKDWRLLVQTLCELF